MKFKNFKGLIFLLIISLTLFSSCSGNKNTETTTHITETTRNNSIGYEQISGEEAKRLMDTETDYIIVDARTIEEFNEGHIEGAILIPEYEITHRAEKELPNKDQLIHKKTDFS